MGCLDNPLENMLGMIGWATVSRKISFSSIETKNKDKIPSNVGWLLETRG